MGDCSVHSLTTDFRCSYHGFTLIRTQVIVFLLDLGITKCFMKFFCNFERVLLATRGCSRTLKTPNSPPVAGRSKLRLQNLNVGQGENYKLYCKVFDNITQV